ncbi:nuclear transport factor 2 family protein [Roseococcus sp. YIM B11640]|uniref:nuclear transport factor 2 family protein n=1 Tax=Roseococcus sp. YIM B11640 TaxID=3133973 RepID=UPI003C7AFC18
MSDASQVAEDYMALWNEADSGRRRAMLAKSWTEGAKLADPFARCQGHAEIDALIGGVQSRFPGIRFALTTPADGFGEFVRFSWGAGPVEGSDVLMMEGGKIASVIGFIDKMPG